MCVSECVRVNLEANVNTLQYSSSAKIKVGTHNISVNLDALC